MFDRSNSWSLFYDSFDLNFFISNHTCGLGNGVLRTHCIQTIFIVFLSCFQISVSAMFNQNTNNNSEFLSHTYSSDHLYLNTVCWKVFDVLNNTPLISWLNLQNFVNLPKQLRYFQNFRNCSTCGAKYQLTPSRMKSIHSICKICSFFQNVKRLLQMDVAVAVFVVAVARQRQAVVIMAVPQVYSWYHLLRFC